MAPASTQQRNAKKGHAIRKVLLNKQPRNVDAVIASFKKDPPSKGYVYDIAREEGYRFPDDPPPDSGVLAAALKEPEPIIDLSYEAPAEWDTLEEEVIPEVEWPKRFHMWANRHTVEELRAGLADWVSYLNENQSTSYETLRDANETWLVGCKDLGTDDQSVQTLSAALEQALETSGVLAEMESLVSYFKTVIDARMEEYNRVKPIAQRARKRFKRFQRWHLEWLLPTTTIKYTFLETDNKFDSRARKLLRLFPKPDDEAAAARPSSKQLDMALKLLHPSLWQDMGLRGWVGPHRELEVRKEWGAEQYWYHHRARRRADLYDSIGDTKPIMQFKRQQVSWPAPQDSGSG